ncbi:TPA: hypothetical protein ACY4Q9_002985 [Clostridium perfringens]|uniref:Uncharacterized protein n=1 Tax=Clostridium perfringens TaxID=1502 RepID=A0AAW9KCM7_CLOPF|nr:hypothetical protein [Clostridium perfringens]MDK0616144.1 hypothetical protein [Clostridium perfringens]MDU2049274.1 hypothetical protein [Clostridium perfringens]MDZ4949149.1 hypothetical protein [Clostridium perfringens]MDZ7542193.1 hypothetical protein [Clostridium perfringens]
MMTRKEFLTKLSSVLTPENLTNFCKQYDLRTSFYENDYIFEKVLTIENSQAFYNPEEDLFSTLHTTEGIRDTYFDCVEFYIKFQFIESHKYSIKANDLTSIHRPSRLTVDGYFEMELEYHKDKNCFSIHSVDIPNINLKKPYYL